MVRRAIKDQLRKGGHRYRPGGSSQFNPCRVCWPLLNTGRMLQDVMCFPSVMIQCPVSQKAQREIGDARSANWRNKFSISFPFQTEFDSEQKRFSFILPGLYAPRETDTSVQGSSRNPHRSEKPRRTPLHPLRQLPFCSRRPPARLTDHRSRLLRTERRSAARLCNRDAFKTGKAREREKKKTENKKERKEKKK